MPHFSDDLFIGAAPVGGSPSDGNPSFMDRGIGPVGRVFIYDIVPAAGGTALVAALQTLAGAGNLVLTAGAGTQAIVNNRGEAVIRLDTPRRVTLTSAANLSAVNFTLTADDIYGRRFTSTIAGPNANTVPFPKAVRDVISIAASAAVGSNVSAGTNDAFGLPFVVPDAGYLISAKWDATLAQNAGTFVAADTAAPSASTGDPRGIYTPAGNAANGSRRLVLMIGLRGIAAGPNATLTGAIGASQF